MAPQAPREEPDFMEIGFFKNLWFWLFAVLMVLGMLIGLLLIGIFYATSGIRLDPENFGMEDLDFDEQ